MPFVSTEDVRDGPARKKSSNRLRGLLGKLSTRDDAETETSSGSSRVEPATPAIPQSQHRKLTKPGSISNMASVNASARPSAPVLASKPVYSTEIPAAFRDTRHQMYPTEDQGLARARAAGSSQTRSPASEPPFAAPPRSSQTASRSTGQANDLTRQLSNTSAGSHSYTQPAKINGYYTPDPSIEDISALTKSSLGKSDSVNALPVTNRSPLTPPMTPPMASPSKVKRVPTPSMLYEQSPLAAAGAALQNVPLPTAPRPNLPRKTYPTVNTTSARSTSRSGSESMSPGALLVSPESPKTTLHPLPSPVALPSTYQNSPNDQPAPTVGNLPGRRPSTTVEHSQPKSVLELLSTLRVALAAGASAECMTLLDSACAQLESASKAEHSADAPIPTSALQIVSPPPEIELRTIECLLSDEIGFHNWIRSPVPALVRDDTSADELSQSESDPASESDELETGVLGRLNPKSPKRYLPAAGVESSSRKTGISAS